MSVLARRISRFEDAYLSSAVQLNLNTVDGASEDHLTNSAAYTRGSILDTETGWETGSGDLEFVS